MTEINTDENALTKPNAQHAPRSLAKGERIAMRLWENEQPGKKKDTTSQPYEAVGLVLHGEADLIVADEVIRLTAGDSWVVPPDTPHRYEIRKTFTAVEATSPPARSKR